MDWSSGRSSQTKSVLPGDTGRRENQESPFLECPDVASINSGKHQAQRMDTFRTPTKIDKPVPVPGRLDKRFGLGDSYTLQDIFEKAFAKCLTRLNSRMLDDIKDSVELAHADIRKEIEQRDSSLAAVLSRVLDKVEAMEETNAKCTGLEATIQGILQPVCDEIKNSEVSYKSALKNVDDRVAETCSAVLKGLRDVKSDVEAGEQLVKEHIREEIRKVHLGTDVDDLVRGVEQQMAKVHDLQAGMRADFLETSDVVKKMQMEGEGNQEKVERELKLAIEQKVETMLSRFDQMSAHIQSTEQAELANTKMVIHELAKIQQALNIDFAQILVEINGGIGEVKQAHQEQVEAQEAANQAALCHEPSDHALAVQVKRRVREFYAQTEETTFHDGETQTDHSLMAPPKRAKKWIPQKLEEMKDMVSKQKEADSTKGPQRAIFADAEAMKRKMRENLIRPQYNVMDYYYQDGVFQAIARSWVFEHLTLLIIFCNAIWIGVDTDNNDATVLSDADAVFQIVENFFCVFFTMELLVRFFAFERKVNAFRDRWFCFDAILVALMVLETWIIPLLFVITQPGDKNANLWGDATILRMVRLVRMLRISRMARLLRAMPELLILIKGIGAASRSVLVFFVLWLVIIYVFAILFRQITDGEDIGRKYFDTVPDAMNTLLLDGVLPDHSMVVNNVADSQPICWPVIMAFIMLAGVCVMYMLVGVLVDVVGVIAAAEKEGMIVSHVANSLRDAFHRLGRDTDDPITRFEFQQIVATPEISYIISNAGVDVLTLVDMVDVFFEDVEVGGVGLYFAQFVEVVLNMRGAQPARVKDVKAQIRIIKKIVTESSDFMTKKLSAEIAELHKQMLEIRTMELVELAEAETVSHENSDMGSAPLHSARQESTHLGSRHDISNHPNLQNSLPVGLIDLE